MHSLSLNVVSVYKDIREILFVLQATVAAAWAALSFSFSHRQY